MVVLLVRDFVSLSRIECTHGLSAVRTHCFEVIPKMLYEAIKLRQDGKINALDTAIAYARWQMRASFAFNTRMLTDRQHEVAETLLSVVGGKVGMMKKNMRAASAYAK